jgi:DNA-binding protein Fis
MVLKRFIDNIERSIIVKVLMRARGNQKVAAKVLGIKYTTLNEKIKKYGIRFQKQPVMSNF